MSARSDPKVRHHGSRVGALRCARVYTSTAHLRPRGRLPLVRRIAKMVLGPYMRLYHGLRIEAFENLPESGPALIVLNHASLLDVPALMVLDPFPNTSTVVKASLLRVPLVRWVLRNWGGIGVERQGRDSSGVRQMLEVLRHGGVLAVAAEGRRTRDGRLAPINPVLARIAVSTGVPVVPLAIRGSYEALPPGAKLPRPRRITVRAGKPFTLQRGTSAAEAAARIGRELAALLPDNMQPRDQTQDLEPGLTV